MAIVFMPLWSTAGNGHTGLTWVSAGLSESRAFIEPGSLARDSP
jgi:hypothetical protein